MKQHVCYINFSVGSTPFLLRNRLTHYYQLETVTINFKIKKGVAICRKNLLVINWLLLNIK